MKKFLSVFFSFGLVTSFLMTPFFVSAQTIDANSTGLKVAGDKTGLAGFCTGNANDCVLSLIGNLISTALGFVGIILLGILLYAGFLWMTAGGDTKKVDSARTMIKNGVIGIVIVGSAYAISSFVITRLGSAFAGGGAEEAPQGQPKQPGP